MTKIIPTEIGVIIENYLPIEQSTVNKLSNPENANRIKAHLADINCEQEIRTDDKTTMHILRTTIYEELSLENFEMRIRQVLKNHEEFLENVNLRMPEIQLEPEPTKQEERVVIQDEIEAAKQILKDFETQELTDNGAILILLPKGIGMIDVGFFRRLLKKYLE